jgi:hypothetical protein
MFTKEEPRVSVKTPKLDEQQVHFYKENGYLLYHHPVLSEDKLQRLEAIFNELVEKNPQMRTDAFDKPHFEEERLLEFLMDDDVLDLVEPLIGPNIGLFSSHFISKEPGKGRRTPWHEDSKYWANQNQFDRYDGIVTVWLALDRTDRENGCMKVIPGSHHTPDSAYREVDENSNLFGTEIDEIDDSKAVYFELERNECSLHDGRLVHGADPNTSSRRRCGYTMRYFDQSMKCLDPVTPHYYWHCRGVNVAGNPVQNPDAPGAKG